MKKLCTLILALAALPLFAQITIDDFENTANTWDNISCASAIVDNPYKNGLNLSCSCLQIVRAPGCDNWSGAIYRLPQSLTGYKYVHALMYRNNAHQPNVKVTDNGTNLDIAPLTTIVANQWQDVVFDISNQTSIDFIFFMADRDNLTEDAVVYIDDIVLSNDATERTTPNRQCGTTGAYELVWNADFASDQLPANWNIEVNGDGGGNNELQYYCAKAVTLGKDPVEGKHCLILTATKESYGGRDCTSGRVNTLNHTYFKYGKIEARIWFPNTANGLWPAFWMMGNDFPQAGWPACGETDIVELGNSGGFNGTQDWYFNGASHWGPNWQTHCQDYNSVIYDYSVEDGFHIFTCIWTPQRVSMYVDRDAHPTANPYYEISIPASSDDYAPGKYFHKPEFIIFNLAVGGNFPGIYSVSQVTALGNGSRSMYVDWVRVYQRGDQGESFYSDVPSEAIEGVSTGVEHAEADVAPQKILRDGQLLIQRGNALYDLQGNSIH